MANTYYKIASSTVGAGGAANIEFTSIPNTYTDLLIVYSIRTNYNGSTDEAILTFNSNTSNYSWRMLYANNSTAFSTVNPPNDGIYGMQVNGNTSTTDTFSNGQIYIPNYTSSNYKLISSDAAQEDNQTNTSYLKLTSGIWSNTDAITSLKIGGASGSFMQYSTAYLYGIKKN